jgi:hypothetical protein
MHNVPAEEILKPSNSQRRGSGAARSIMLILASFAMLVLAACDTEQPPPDTVNGTPVPQLPGDPEPTPDGGKPLIGVVRDLNTGKPIPGAEVIASGVLTATAEDGRFYFDSVSPTDKIEVVAEGYENATVEPGTNGDLTVDLKPDSIGGKVTDASTGKPLAQVLVRLDFPKPAQPVTGTTPVTGTNGVEITPTVTLTDSYRVSGLAAPLMATPVATEESEEEAVPEAVTTPKATLIPPTPTATPTPPKVPPTGEGFVATYTDENGEFKFNGAPPGSTFTFKMPGYALLKVPADAPRKDVAMTVFKAEAIYITANVASVRPLLDDLLEWAKDSRINSIVLNVQNDASEWVFDVQNADVREADNTELLLPNMKDLVAELRQKGFYMIARVVTFQQKTMAEAKPAWAVRSGATGGVWKGGYAGHQKWLDASNPDAQDHLVAMTKEVLGLGFDEVQYDYVRFPSDPAPGEKGPMVFSKPLTETGKIKELAGFLKKAYAVIEPTDAFMSIDVFGYAVWPDIGGEPYMGVIGQSVPDLIDYTDYICPMIYPSHFVIGELGCKVPARCAYELVKASGEHAKPRFEGKRAKYRPWLQDFDWGETDYTSRNSKLVHRQIEACEETDCWGWQMWDPANEYLPRSAFEKKE